MDEGREFFKQAQVLNPDNKEAYIGLGIAALKKEECQKAKDLFLKALEIDEKNALALGYLRKTALECFKDEEGAKRFEEQCISVQEEKGVKLEK